MTADDFKKLADAATPEPPIPPGYATVVFAPGAQERSALFEAVFTERECIYKSLLLREMVELEANEDGVTAQEMRYWLARLDAESGENP
jgi:hypothetical protein